MKKNFRNLNNSKRSFVVSLMMAVCSILFSLSAQNTTVSGIVVDAATGEPIIGASVILKNSTVGTMTDIDGNFSLQVPQNSTLNASYLGYVAQDVSVGTQTSLKIALKEDAQQLDEIVVVGFGTQKKVNLTGSVGIATAKDLQDRPVMLASQALQGLVPGLNISQNNGSLETRSSINIRGTGTIGDGSKGDPLILIDGIEGDINALNPQDIENVSVLKDAAASSIYGSKASFGVILITTKRGKSGKTVVNYNNSFRWNSPVLMPKMMDSYSFALYMNAAAINSGGNAHFGNEWLQRIQDFQAGKITTTTTPNPNNPSRWEDGFDSGGNDNQDYYDVIYRDKAFSQEHNVSFSGGSDKITYYTSFNFLDQGGMMRFNQDKYGRYGATAKISYDLTSWARFNYSNRFIREKYHRPAALTNSLFSDLGRQGWPVLPLYDPNGHLFNWNAVKLRDGGTDKKETDYLYQQAQFVLEPIKDWVTNIELNYSTTTANRHWDKKVIYLYDVADQPYVWDKSSNVHEDMQKDNLLGINAYTNYAFTLNEKHNFKAMVGLQSENMKQTLFGLQRDGILVPSLPEVDLTSGLDIDGKPITPAVNGARNEWTTLGFFGRLNYDYQGKYLIEGNLRYDGSSRFRSGSRWVWNPSVSIGWNIAQEDFWESLSGTVGLLKLRASYGQLANQNTNAWYPTYTAIGLGTGPWLQNGLKPNISWSPYNLIDIDMTWEKVRNTNFGLDFGMLNNRLTGSVDYFIRDTKDMIGPAPERPAILGVGVPKANNTDLRTSGFELQVGWQDRLNNGLSYGAKFMLSDYRTKITKYPNLTGSLDQVNDGTNYIQGRYTGEIWGYETIGIAKTDEEMKAHLATLNNGGQNALGSSWTAGDIMYKDLNGDGKIDNGSNTLSDHGDLKVIGNNTPRYQFGIDLNASWKGFDVRAFFQGVMKRDIWQGSYYFWGADGGGIWWSTGLKEHADYFRDDANDPKGLNLNSYYPRPLFNSKNKETQSGYLQDASYIRLKNLQLGYTLPANLTQKFAVSKLRVFISGENLWTGTSLSDIFDPETINGGWGGNVYPISKTISFGLNINL